MQEMKLFKFLAVLSAIKPFKSFYLGFFFSSEFW